MKIKRLLLKMGGVCFQMGLCGPVQDEEGAMARKEGWAARRRGRAHSHRGGLMRKRQRGAHFQPHNQKICLFSPRETWVVKRHDAADTRREKDKETLLKDGQD